MMWDDLIPPWWDGMRAIMHSYCNVPYQYHEHKHWSLCFHCSSESDSRCCLRASNRSSTNTLGKAVIHILGGVEYSVRPYCTTQSHNWNSLKNFYFSVIWILLIIIVCMWKCMYVSAEVACHSTYVEVGGQLSGLGSLFPLCLCSGT